MLSWPGERPGLTTPPLLVTLPLTELMPASTPPSNWKDWLTARFPPFKDVTPAVWTAVLLKDSVPTGATVRALARKPPDKSRAAPLRTVRGAFKVPAERFRVPCRVLIPIH